MASPEAEDIDDVIVEPGSEPGASKEKMLVATDSFEEYEQEINNTIDVKDDSSYTKTTTILNTNINRDDAGKNSTSDDTYLVSLLLKINRGLFFKIFVVDKY